MHANHQTVDSIFEIPTAIKKTFNRADQFLFLRRYLQCSLPNKKLVFIHGKLDP